MTDHKSKGTEDARKEQTPEDNKPIHIQTFVSDIMQSRTLWYKIHVFIYDLRNFKEDPKARERLDSVVDASYIGLPYFTMSEIAQLKSTLIDTQPKSTHRQKSQPKGDIHEFKTLESIIDQTLTERLDRRQKKRDASGDYRVCAAHDLAPIFESAFGISPKALAQDRNFCVILGRSGLNLESTDKWDGVQKKGFGNKKKGKF